MCINAQQEVPSLPLVALGLRAAEDSAGFLGTFGTLKAAWAEEERFPSTLSSSSKLRSSRRGQTVVLAMHHHCRKIWVKLFAIVVIEFLNNTANHYDQKRPISSLKTAEWN